MMVIIATTADLPLSLLLAGGWIRVMMAQGRPSERVYLLLANEYLITKKCQLDCSHFIGSFGSQAAAPEDPMGDLYGPENHIDCSPLRLSIYHGAVTSSPSRPLAWLTDWLVDVDGTTNGDYAGRLLLALLTRRLLELAFIRVVTIKRARKINFMSISLIRPRSSAYCGSPSHSLSSFIPPSLSVCTLLLSRCGANWTEVAMEKNGWLMAVLSRVTGALWFATKWVIIRGSSGDLFLLDGLPR